MAFMFRCWKTQKFFWLFIAFLIPLEVMARPTKEEKARRRTAFWGVFSDTYRASGCLGFEPADLDCAKTAVNDALLHASMIEGSITQHALGFSNITDCP